jgi:apolipoprotein N-acyltransferase
MRAVFDLHADLTRDLAARLGDQALDLVVWPEDGAHFDLGKHPEVAAELGELATAVGAPLLVGSAEYPESGGRYNVSLLVAGPDGEILARYAKRHPVPFGEYIPFRTLARAVTSAVDRVSVDMIAGEEVGIVDLPVARTGTTVPLGDVICFEVVHDSLVTDAVRAGAQLLVVQTNNSSFGTTAESAQQLAMTRLRAIEQGRAAVHISTTGVSALISPAGIVLEALPAYTPGEMIHTLPLRTTLSPAARWGRAIGLTFAVSGAGLAVAGIVGAITRRRRKP